MKGESVAKLTHPSWWTSVPLWRSSSRPSSSSSFECLELSYAHYIDFYFRQAISVLQSILSARDVTFFLILPLLTIPHREMTTILLIVVPFVALVFWASLLPLVQLLLQLLVALGKSFDCCRQGLHLSFQGVRGIPCLLVDGSRRTRLDHATLYLRSSDTANHLFPQMVSTDGYLKKGKTRTK